jgi:hypothetical protein
MRQRTDHDGRVDVALHVSSNGTLFMLALLS